MPFGRILDGILEYDSGESDSTVYPGQHIARQLAMYLYASITTINILQRKAPMKPTLIYSHRFFGCIPGYKLGLLAESTAV